MIMRTNCSSHIMIKLDALRMRFNLLQAPRPQSTASSRTCCHSGLAVSHQMNLMQCMPKSQMKRSGATHLHMCGWQACSVFDYAPVMCAGSSVLQRC